ncbi:hypothetical protein KM043_002277 [Ampulex compressa]|nr:hypothetical protein KM043_002277 [Ampulex compressa]
MLLDHDWRVKSRGNRTDPERLTDEIVSGTRYQRNFRLNPENLNPRAGCRRCSTTKEGAKGGRGIESVSDVSSGKLAREECRSNSNQRNLTACQACRAQLRNLARAFREASWKNHEGAGNRGFIRDERLANEKISREGGTFARIPRASTATVIM